MKESQFQTKFNLWCKYNWHITARFELKITQGKSIPFSVVKPHQNSGLSNKKIIYKLPDVGQLQKPFDSICLVNVPGYVVVMFYTRGCKTFYMFSISEWGMLKNGYKKSLDEAAAKRFGIQYKFN